jgi:N-acetylmuramoyl-L-alanine amidase/beta-lactamase regulating signal transducer with metallopeptidase domain
MNPLMNTLMPFHWIDATGWALLHFLWQGTALALLLRLALLVTPRDRPALRYALSGLTLAAMVVAVCVTFFRECVSPPVVTGAVARGPLPTIEWRGMEGSGDIPPVASTGRAVSVGEAPESWTFEIRPWLSWLVAAWMTGVILMAVRYLRSWRTVQRWKLESAPAQAQEWTTLLARCCQRSGLRRGVALLVSASAQVPCVAGWLTPVILMPAALIKGISLAQLEAILAHELAHVRRRDFLVNLIQCAVEMVLFFHPAVWWVSARMREEREHCCDDMAAAICGGAVPYARALFALESWRAGLTAVAPAATGGGLLQRIRRLTRRHRNDALHGGPLAALAMIAAVLVGTLSVLPSRAAKELPADPEPIVEATAEQSAVPENTEKAKPTNFAWTIKEHEGRNYVTASDVQRFYHFTSCAREGKAAFFRSRTMQLKWEAGSDRIFFNNILFRTSYPVLEAEGELLLSQLDLSKLVEPVLRPEKAGGKPFTTVVLDPGHGGIDVGGAGKLGVEKFYTLDLALRLKKLLEANGFKVVMTRDADFDVARPERIRIANETPHSIFVSLHFNTATAKTRGMQTLALTPHGAPNTDQPSTEIDQMEHPGHAHDTANIALATAVHANMVMAMGGMDRGVTRQRFDVLAGLHRPAILVEGEFLSHAESSAQIHDPAWREQLAKAIMGGVKNYRDAIGPKKRPANVPLRESEMDEEKVD